MTGSAYDMPGAKSDRGPLLSHTCRYAVIGLCIGNGSLCGGRAVQNGDRLNPASFRVVRVAPEPPFAVACQS